MYSLTREQFCDLAQCYNLIPLYREILADLETPVSAFMKVAQGDYTFLLESVEGGERLGRYSFIGFDPSLVLKTKNRQVEILRSKKRETFSLAEEEDPLHILKRLMQEFRWVGDPTLPPFAGGAVGYLGYDIVRFFERLPDLKPDDLQLPDCFLLFTENLLVFDHVRHRIKVLVNARVEGEDPSVAYSQAVARIEEMIARLHTPLSLSPKTPYEKTTLASRSFQLSANMTPDQFCSAVRRAKEYIAAGDIFQVVLSQRFTTRTNAHPLNIYRALRTINPSPYMYYLSYGDLKVIGSSPEILVTEKRGKVTVRPIAGTIRRGQTPEEDLENERRLLSDEKERAEHIMLVDLGRNDIGRVCRYGSVRVSELMVIERYSHVMHIVSNVEGELAPGRDAFDVFRACFPAGTVSGAPKIRAMEIIEELEPTKRGPYAGAIGYFSFSGEMDTAITIRTIVLKGQDAYIQVGAGIVADSIPEREHQECLNKAKALMKALEMAEAGLE